MSEPKGRAPTYLLRLPASIKREAERLAPTAGASFNQFVAAAVAEKISAMRTAAYFEERRAVADWAAFDKLMGRPGGVPPREGMKCRVTRRNVNR